MLGLGLSYIGNICYKKAFV